MPDKKSVRRHLAEHDRFRIIRLFFGWIESGLFFCSAALVIDANIAETQVFDVVSRNSAYDRAVFWISVVSNNVADHHAAKGSDRCSFFWPTVTISQANKYRRIC